VSRSILDALRLDRDELLPHRGRTRCCLALSGGIDSMVLLDALARLRDEAPGFELRAVHVDHGLTTGSQSWGLAARQAAESRAVPFEVRRIAIDPGLPGGLEAAARNARRAALADGLADGEVLATAHHADDQLETLLLALVRGAGLAGLAGMGRITPLGRGWHWRPLLELYRAELLEIAQARAIDWCEDPTNRDLGRDRNYLRHAILPPLRARWPKVASAAVRSARHVAVAADLIDALAMEDLRRCSVHSRPDVGLLATLDAERRLNLLRFWLRLHGLRMPSERRLHAIDTDLLTAAPDRNPVIDFEGDVTLRRYRGRLYVVRDNVAAAREERIEWRPDAPLALPGDSGELALVAQATGTLDRGQLPARLEVRFRIHGERVQLSGRANATSLGELLRELHVLPWMRDAVPLLFAGETLIAIGDSTFGTAHAIPAARRVAVEWRAAPVWREEANAPDNRLSLDPGIR
jgi:tRNA(Ile)-lysidine synthase